MKKICLAGCIILDKGKILLLRRKSNNCYELPGGKIDENEQPERAATRELKEELLCDVELIRKAGEKDFEEDGYIMGYTWFLAKVKNNQTPEVGEPEKFGGFKYLPINELDGYKLSSNMKNLLMELKNGNILLE
jgi:8-oxo-dGTP diphosphatase